MKIFRLICIVILYVTVMIFAATSAWAQDKQQSLVRLSQGSGQVGHTSTKDVLEFSLMSLRASAQEVAKKNDWLLSENKTYQDNIHYLRKELRSLQQEKSRLLGRSWPMDDDVRDTAEDSSLLNLESISLDKERGAKNRQEEVQMKIIAVRNDIIQLKDKLNSIDKISKAKKIDGERKTSLSTTEESKKTFFDLTRKFNQLKTRYAKPLRIVDDLKEEQRELNQRLIIAKTEYETALDEGEENRFETDNVENQNEGRFLQFNENIHKLKLRSQELEEILSLAKKKIFEHKLDSANYEQEEAQLEENLLTMRKENVALKEEIATLQNTLRSFESD